MDNLSFFSAKQLARESNKCKKAEKSERNKIKKAIEEGNMEIARIHAENAIRQKNQSLNFLKLSSRMDAVVQRMQSANSLKNLNKSMTKVTKAMTKAIKSMDAVKISKTMDQFEKNFEDLDVTSATMENTIQQTTAQATPQSEVDALMGQVADEHGLEFAGDMDVVVPSDQLQLPKVKEDDLEKRFAELKDD